jgi:hypothetical protein
VTDPQTVISPKDKWTLLAVLFQSPEKEDGWSLAIGQWESKKCLAIRWNGNKTNPKGNPCSHGMPTWFVVPNDLDDVLLTGIKIPADKRALAKALLSH